MSFTIGSLFDGSGGFPLAAAMCGGVPKWASEIEPYPIAVTSNRFPNMKHLGNISEVNGAEIEPVDIITFGSPCQDLSVAGKRAGLKHTENGDDETTRSGLFMEAVRIIKEMRGATNGVYPRIVVWENVPGAFSSNGGEDFRIVLEELIKIAEPTAVMPAVPQKGWAYADSYCGDGWSVAYRVFDAQYWGVPQRRRRIYLVADFRGQRAREVLFEREGLRGYFAEGRKPWKATAGTVADCLGTTDCAGSCINHVPYTLKIRGGCDKDSHGKAAGKGALIQTNLSATLAAAQDQYLFQPVVDAVGVDVYNQSLTGDVAKTLSSAATDADHVPYVLKTQHLFENHSQDTRYKWPLDVSPMLPAQLGTGGNNTPFVVESTTVVLEGNGSRPSHRGDGFIVSDVMYTLNTTEHHAVAYRVDGCEDDANSDAYTTPVAIDRAAFNQGVNAQYAPQYLTDGTMPTLVAKGPNAVAYKQEVRYIVRRLTPTECARLQGFPDAWGHPDEKDSMTDEEYAFWLSVRNTHASINGKVVKDYSKEQILKWYNGLHTDSAEYKMWGNGIALPNALYVMQGIADVFNRERGEPTT